MKQTTTGIPFPAPTGGVNSLDSLAAMSANDSVYCINLLPAEYGLRVREGYVAHSALIPDSVDVRTILGYRGTKDDGSKNKFFCTTNNGIYDITVPATPVEKVQFTTTTGNAGWGTSIEFVAIGGSYLLYADEVNGGFRYEEDTNTWAAIPDLTLGGSAFNPDQIVNVMVWKNRIWFTVRDKAVAYYLPIGQVSGALTAFDFGPKFSYGGSLIGVWSWTVEGGSGINDYLVALSRGGDALVYQGTDPSNAAAFGMKGSWYIGSTPAGRNFVTNFGGDLLVLTEAGLLRMSKVISGIGAESNEAYLSRKLYRFIREEMAESKSKLGWNIVQHPRLGYLMICVPPKNGSSNVQFVMSGTTGAWTIYKGVPMNCVGEHLGELYFGTKFDDGRSVFKMTGNVDAALPIVWSLLTSYQGLQDPTKFKRVQFIRPIFIGALIPVYDIQARYDFDITSIIGSPTLQDAGLGIWDAGQWDSALWGGEWITESKAYGGAGLGRYIAVALRGSSVVPTTLISMDLMVDVGGML